MGKMSASPGPAGMGMGMGMISISIFLIGFGLFARGYFLLRPEWATQATTSSRPPDDPTIETARNRKLFLFVVDGMRLDYMKSMPSQDRSDDDSSVYNRLTVFPELCAREPGHCLFYGINADPPTVTSVRLRAIASGTVPSFMELFSNLNCDRVLEDSWVEQWRRRSCPDSLDLNCLKQFILAGDDTWQKLFPDTFKFGKPLASFDTHDLYTVDNEIEEFFGFKNALEAEHQSNVNISSNSWKLIVSHFLGLDHVGHTYHAFHPLISERLDRMNKLIELTVKSLPEDAVLMVMGDHGITDDGNHGGATREEVQTGLFIYSKQGIVPAYKSSLLYWDNISSDFHWTSVKDMLENPRFHSQVDLSPTISALLDLPIPFSSVGGIIPELFIRQEKVSQNLDYFLLSSILAGNVEQIFDYFIQYFGTNEVDDKLSQNLPSLSCGNRTIQIKGLNLQALSICNSSEILGFIQSCFNFFKVTSLVGNNLWVNYDVPQMVVGLLIMSSSLAFTCSHYVLGISRQNMFFPDKTTLTLCSIVTISAILQIIGPFSDNLINFEHIIIFTSMIIIATIMAVVNISMSSSIWHVLRSLSVLLQIILINAWNSGYKDGEYISNLANSNLLFILLLFITNSSKGHSFCKQLNLRVVSSLLPILLKLFHQFLNSSFMKVGDLNKVVIIVCLFGIYFEAGYGIFSKLLGRSSQFKSKSGSALALSTYFTSILYICFNSSAKFCIIGSLILIFASLCLDFIQIIKTADQGTLCGFYYMFLFLFIRYSYFASEHSIKFTDVPISVGTKVFEGFDSLFSPFAVIINSLGFEPMLLFIFGSINSFNNFGSFSFQNRRQILSNILLWRTCMVVSCSLACFILRRHLMNLAIFTPKLVTEAVHYLFTLFLFCAFA